MDESMFQQELVRLKNHVATVSATYQLSSCPSQDAFGDQLDDVKSSFQRLQASLDRLTDMRSHQKSPRASPHVGPAKCMSTDNLSTHQNLTLPSGPLFWQLFTSLRTDVRGLDNRIATLEQNFSDLDDRVDKLEPPQFTPTGSENGFHPYSGWDQPQAAASMPQKPVEDPIPYAAELNNWYAGQYQRGHSFATARMNPFSLTNGSSQHLGSAGLSAVPEGLAFRDREIAQLEELMREGQGKLAHTENLLWERESQIRYLSAQGDHLKAKTVDLERICAEQESTLQTQRSMLQEKQAELEHLQAECIAKDASLQEWIAKHHAAQQKYLRKMSQMYYTDQQIQQLCHSIFEIHCGRRGAADRVTATKDEEIQKSRDLFEAKETVSEEGKIIARGADLIEDRHGEIERLGRELKLSSEDFQRENQERIKIAKTLKERDEEISQLRASLTNALMPRSVLGNEAEGGNSAQEGRPLDHHNIPLSRVSCSPFAITAAGVKGETLRSHWSPKAFHHHGQLPHEQKRASAWETGSTSDAARRSKFGEPGSLGSLTPTAAPAKNVLRERKRDLRRSDSLRLLERLALIEEGTRRPERTTTKAGNNSRRHRLPLDSFYPPQPLSTSLSQKASDADKTEAAHTDGENAGRQPQ